MSIASRSGLDWYAPENEALGILHDAHFKAFNATESQTAIRARNKGLNGLRTLERAFAYLQSNRKAESDARIQRMDEAVLGRILCNT